MNEEIKKLPKVELHLHLDGSVRTSTASELLNEDVKAKMKVDSDVTDLNNYLEKFAIPVSLMQTKENLIRISKELAEDLKTDNVIYAEIRFAPLKHLEQGLTPEEVIDAVLEGINKVDIKTNLILCAMRGDTIKNNKRVVDLTKKYLNKGVCALDLAGAEALFKTKEYKELFEYAKSLGHGVRVEENEETLQKIIDHNITLEVCPASNINTGIFPSYEKHNIKRLYDKGVKVTINTDNRTVSNITISEEYIRLKNSFNFTIKDFNNMNINAINASFLTEEEKTYFRNKINNY